MSPQRSAATGKPLKLASGAPMKDCCCPNGAGGCGNCDPSLPYQYTVTLADLGGDFSWANGTHILINDGTPYPGQSEPGCYWHKDVDRTERRVGLVTWTFRLTASISVPHDWVFVLRMGGTPCFIQFRLADVDDLCDGATGSYPKTLCLDGGCPYQNGDGYDTPVQCYEPPDTPTSPPKPDCACYASGSATCVVS